MTPASLSRSKLAEISAAAARNACKLCAPLGACVVFSGIEGCVPFLHGSQGCATYIRRYLISHFRDPVDIASSSFGEEDVIFGGARNLKAGLRHVTRQYQPGAIGLATTCLAETIGEDVPRMLAEFRASVPKDELAPIIRVSTPSYAGTHMDGFHATVRAVIEQYAQDSSPHHRMNLLPGFVSPEDLRCLKTILQIMGIEATLLPDYSSTLDGCIWTEYRRLQPGGTPLAMISLMTGAPASLELGRTLAASTTTAAAWLEREHGVPRVSLGLPIGLRETDLFFAGLERLTGRSKPSVLEEERGRLIDAFVDGHKYLMGRRAIVFGDQDLVVGLVSFLCEVGVQPVLCASGSRTGCFEQCLRDVTMNSDASQPLVLEGTDHTAIEEQARELQADFILGSSKGYPMARELGVPLIRVGFPIHDRIGGQRVLHLGYGGAQQLFDRIVNTMIESCQGSSEVGYSYL